jgi:hypothetical protein
MKRIALVLLLAAGLVTFAKISSLVPQAAYACDGDGSDGGGGGNSGDSGGK